MGPREQLQQLLSEVASYELSEIASMLPLVAALESAMYGRLVLRQHAGILDIDYRLIAEDIADATRPMADGKEWA